MKDEEKDRDTMGGGHFLFIFSCRVVTYREDREVGYIEDDGVISGGITKRAQLRGTRFLNGGKIGLISRTRKAERREKKIK